MTKPDLSGSRAKIDWANSQINVLASDVSAFIARKPYRVSERWQPTFVGKPNAIQADLFCKGRFLELALVEPVPNGIKASTGMILQAQRDSLDYLVNALARRNGAANTKDVYFPIASNEADFWKKPCQRKVQRLAEADRDAIAALKPYKGGNDLLYALNWLNNKSKHRELVAIATGVSEMHFVGNGYIRRLLILPPGNTLCPEEQLICLDADPGVSLDFTASLAFRESYAHSQPIIDALREFSRLTHSILEKFA